MATSDRSVVIGPSTATVDGVDYTQSLRLGGKGTETARNLMFLAPGNCNLEVVLTSAGSSDTKERTLNIAAGEFSNVIATMPSNTNVVSKEIRSLEVETDTPVYLYSASNGINIYAIYLKTFDLTATGISEAVAERSQEGVYNLQGQRVVAPAKGLYIVNGVKMVVK